MQTVHSAPGLGRNGHQRRALKLRQKPFKAFAQVFQLALFVGLKIPFVHRNHNGTAFAFGQIGDAQVLLFKGDIRIQQNHHNLGEFHRTQTVADAQLFELFLHLGAFTHPGGVKDPHRHVEPVGLQRNRITGDPRFRSGEQAILAHNLVDQGGFTRVRTPYDGHLQGLGLGGDGHGCLFVAQFGFFLGQVHICFRRIGLRPLGETVGDWHQMGVKVVQPLAVFGRQADRFAKAKAVGLDHTGVGGFALCLVGGQNDMGGFLAQDIGKDQIRRRDTHAGVDHEQADVRHIHGTFGQAAHPALQTVVGDFFKSGGIHHSESQVGKPRRAFAQIARHTGLIIDQRQLFTDKTVEQRGFPDVGTAHNGEGERHGTAPKTRSSPPLSLFAA